MRQLLNPLMLWGALLGLVIAHGFTTLHEAWSHKGPAMVWHEPEGVVKVSEQQYKREHYTEGVGSVIIGVVIWVAVVLEIQHRKQQADILNRPDLERKMYAKRNPDE